MERIARSWQLLVQSYAVLMKDKELMVLPLVSGLVILLVTGGFVLGMFGTGLLEGGVEEQEGILAAVGGLFYVVTYTIGIFFQAAVVAGASERMRGGDPTVGSALRAALDRLAVILLWGLFAGTVGMVIRSIQERSELLGRIVMGLVGAVWSLAVFFMVPVLVMERENVTGSFRRSWALFKQTWGETVVGHLGFGVLGFLLAVPIAAVAGLVFAATGVEWLAVGVGALGMALLALFLTALKGVWIASLYRYATAGETPEGFDRDLLQQAFRSR